MEKFYEAIIEAKKQAWNRKIDLRDSESFMQLFRSIVGNAYEVPTTWLERALNKNMQWPFIGNQAKPKSEKMQIIESTRTQLMMQEGLNDRAADTVLISFMLLGGWRENYYSEFSSFSQNEMNNGMRQRQQEEQNQRFGQTGQKKQTNTVLVACLCGAIVLVAGAILYMSVHLMSTKTAKSENEVATTVQTEATTEATTQATTQYIPPTTQATTQYIPPTTQATTQYTPPTKPAYSNSYGDRLDALYNDYYYATSSSEIAACYSDSDDLLNEIYQDIKSMLGKNSSSFKSLKSDELNWIEERDKAAYNSSNYTETMTKYTLDRCQYLLSYYY